MLATFREGPVLTTNTNTGSEFPHLVRIRTYIDRVPERAIGKPFGLDGSPDLRSFTQKPHVDLHGGSAVRGMYAAA